MRGTVRPRAVLLATVTGLTAFALAACGGNSAAPAVSQSPGAAATAGSAAFNDADVEFVQNMIPHHQQAVQMAQLVASRTADLQIMRLASQIKAAQDPEIATMTGWLRAWGKPMMPAQGHGGMAMPGMMSEADMAKLTSARGTNFDKMFARMMIAHHNGAIQMARDEVVRGANPQAKALAAGIGRSQSAEVSTLQGILNRL